MFFNNKNNKVDTNFLTKVCALLIHAAKIDENYTENEEIIIKKTLLELGCSEEDLYKIIKDAKTIEENSNQILDFTKEVKNMTEQDKIKIVEALWSIIYSNKDADMYETNLMRRLAGLLYIDNKTMGNIKDKIKNQNL
ncbi:TerB family tellurite resistance protein [Candidatus Pelagibacter sp.]|nr:TerB family tellurite resistance protein [Candidatus Pelagibacter sp.]